MLDTEGLLLREAGKVTLLDELALRALADLSQRTSSADFRWLPPSSPIGGHI
jgi:hypothetical protein